MARRTLRDARCLVTGASTGLGRALAEHLARAGARVILAARSEETLQAVAAALIAAGAGAGDVLPVAADVTCAADRRRLFEAAAAQFGALDVVINNAGVGAYGRFESHDETVLRRVFELNVFALAEVARGALPLLRRGRRPALVNIGSVVARRGLPGRPEYSASKFAVAGLTESLRAEWACDGIDVLLINPGFTATEFERHLIVDTTVYATARRRVMSADAVAAATLRALRRGRREVTLSAAGRWLLLVNRLAPWFVDWALRRWTRRLYTSAPAPPPARIDP